MILLNTGTRRLRVLLGGPGALPFIASYVEITTASGELTDEKATPGVTNGVSPVDLVPFPPAGVVSQVKLIWLKNILSASVNAIFRYDDGGITRDFTFAMLPGDLAQYTDGEGWRFFDFTGSLKTGSSTGAPPQPIPGPINTFNTMILPSLNDTYALRKIAAERFSRRI